MNEEQIPMTKTEIIFFTIYIITIIIAIIIYLGTRKGI